MIFPDDYNIKKSDLTVLYYMLLAVLLSYFEGLIPKPFPFLRIGVGNIVILYLILKNDIKNGFYVDLAKVIFSSLFLGKLFTPLFLMGFFGTIISFLFMVLAYKINLSIYTISAIGGLFHNLTQLVVLMFLFHFPINYLLIAIAIIFGTIMGTINALIGARLGLWDFQK